MTSDRNRAARPQGLLLVALLTVAALSGCVTSEPAATVGDDARAPVPDASVAGTLALVTADYDFGAMLIEDAVTQRTYPVRILGTVHFPDGDGPFPTVVFLHGRHASCEGMVTGLVFDEASLSHCRDIEPAATAIPSHRGYDDVAAILVSHGYVVISIDANDINAQDSPRYAGVNGVGSVPPRGDDGLEARARLILRTLDEFRNVNELGGAQLNPALNPLQGNLDLERIGLMGHSRGAEGVTRAPGLAAETGHWSAPAMKAVYALAGMARVGLPQYETPAVPAPIAYATVLPYCDGDVYHLGGADLHDFQVARRDSGPLVQLTFMGTNHNFYNTEWPQDDAQTWAEDPYCAPISGEGTGGTGRLSPEDQQRHHRVYLPAFFRLYLGNESEFLPLFTGRAAPPASACPGGASRCPGLVHVSYYPPATERLVIEDTSDETTLTTNDLGGSSTFAGFTSTTWCEPAAAGSACAYPTVGWAGRLILSVDDSATWRTTFAPTPATAFDTLSFRVAIGNDTDAPPTLRVTLEDTRGTRATANVATYSDALFVPPGEDAQRLVLHQVRIPLSALAKIDGSRLSAIELSFTSETPATVHVAELMLAKLTPE